MRALDLPTLEAYGRHLFEAGHLADEFPHLVDCVTTNKTDFFREPAHFDLLRATIVPRWRRAATGAAQGLERGGLDGGRGLHPGDGPAGHGRRPVRYAILGTDISSEVLDRARTAIYPEEMLAAGGRRTCGGATCCRARPARREGRIVPELRARVRFSGST